MYRKMPMLVRNMCWFAVTIALYLSVGWCIWQIWSVSFNNPRSVVELTFPLMSVAFLFWLRRRTRRVIRGPLYRFAMQAYLIGNMRHT